MLSRALFLIGSLLATTALAAEKYCPVLVRIIDSATSQPVAGVKIQVEYWQHPGKTISLEASEALTDKDGRALLRVFRDAFPASVDSSNVSFVFNLSLESDDYHVTGGRMLFDSKVEKVIRSRDKKAVPNKPDYTFRVDSRGTSEKRQIAHDKKIADDEQQAEEWLAKGLEYWPEQGEGMWPSSAEWLFVSKRWDRPASDSLGTTADLQSIRKVTIAALPGSSPSIQEIRWLTENSAMVGCGWYEGPLAAGSYIFVVAKIEGRWVVYRKYLVSIS